MNEHLEKIMAYLRPDLMDMQAYHVPDATGMIKLDAMENPYLMPEELQTQWLGLLKTVEMNRYPDAHATQLTEKLKQHLNVDHSFEILLGNGSDELIQLLMLAVAKNETVLFPEPTFVMYRILAEIAGLSTHGVPLGQEFDMDLDAMLMAIEEHDPRLVFIAQPNNPTGNVFDQEALTKIIDQTKGFVIIDEAYQAFTQHNALNWALAYPNVLIMRTFQKVGLAGLRLGFLVGQKVIIDQLQKLRLPYNINSLTQSSVTFVLNHYDFCKEQAARICTEREIMFEKLNQMPNITVWKSETNFLLFRAQKSAADIFAGLKSKNILIKNLSKAHPLLDNCLRVTIGTPFENAEFLKVLRELI